MTPERDAYLAKCSKRERIIRRLLGIQKRALRQYKELLTYGYSDDEDYCYSQIALLKTARQALRHELARLKGMDRVVVPRVRGYNCDDIVVGYCRCENDINFYDTYCSNCGRRILWEKVKQILKQGSW